MTSQFKSDIGKIWDSGKQDLPAVANEFATLSLSTSNARKYRPNFTSGAASEAMSGVGTEWKELARTLQFAQATTCTNLHRASKALVKFAEEMDYTDADAAGEIAKAKKDLEYIPTYYLADPAYPEKGKK